jgi:endonuclease YncB( thermonuclease family)
VRLVQIDTPEVFFGSECYGRAASAQTKRLLPAGVRVRLFAEPATDRVDQYGRLLRYVVRVNGSLNVNIRLVAIGAAAPYFYSGRRGRYAGLLETLAKRAKARKLGLWGACPHTRYDPYKGVQNEALRANTVRRLKEDRGSNHSRDGCASHRRDHSGLGAQSAGARSAVHPR